MPASYLGTFPVKKVLSYGPQGPGVLVSSASIIVRRADALAYVPSINSVYEFDSTMWVTNAEVKYSEDSLAEITITAAGRDANAKSTMEIQPGAPYIYGLRSGVPPGAPTFAPSEPLPSFEDYPALASTSAGSAVKVGFVALAGEEQSIIEQYSRVPMPPSINGVALPRYRAPGVYGNKILLPGPNQTFPDPNWRLIYRGYICREIQTSRQGSALVVALYFKESGQLETFASTGPNTGTISAIWDY